MRLRAELRRNLDRAARGPAKVSEVAPLRRVVAWMVVPVPGQGAYDRLVCGHQVRFNGNRLRKRRCVECLQKSREDQLTLW